MRHVVEPVQALFDVFVGILCGSELDLLRLTHHVRGQLHDARREGGAKHEGAVAAGGGDVNRFQVFSEAEVEHAVRFVDDQGLYAVKANLAIAVEVEQTTRRGNHELGTAQLHQLLAERRAADDVAMRTP